MRVGKKGSINALIGAMTEAESKSFYDEQETVLNDLESLLKTFLFKDTIPERLRILKDYEAGRVESGSVLVRLIWSSLEEPIFHTIFPDLRLSFTRSWMPSGSKGF